MEWLDFFFEGGVVIIFTSLMTTMMHVHGHDEHFFLLSLSDIHHD